MCTPLCYGYRLRTEAWEGGRAFEAVLWVGDLERGQGNVDQKIGARDLRMP